MRLRSFPCLAVLAFAVGTSSALASPRAQSDGGMTAVPAGIQLAQNDDDDRRRDRSRRRNRDSRSGGGDRVYTGGRGGDGVYTGGRSRNSGGGDGVYTGGRSRGDGVYRGGNQGTVFCNPQLGCVRDLNINPGSGLGGR